MKSCKFITHLSVIDLPECLSDTFQANKDMSQYFNRRHLITCNHLSHDQSYFHKEFDYYTGCLKKMYTKLIRHNLKLITLIHNMIPNNQT